MDKKELKQLIREELLLEFPRLNRGVGNTFTKELEHYLKIKIAEYSNVGHSKDLDNNHCLIYGHDESHQTWCAILNKTIEPNPLVFGASFVVIFDKKETDVNKQVTKITRSYKFDESFKDSYLKAFPSICLTENCCLVCDYMISPKAKSAWLKLLNSNKLESWGVKRFVLDTSSKTEIKEYDNIESFFGNTDKHRKTLIGIQPLT
jgi:hypothetical protein